MEKPNVKDYQYSDGEMRDLVAYTESLEQYIKHLENKDKNLTISDVVGRSELLKAFCLHGGIQVMVPTKAQNLDELIEDFLESL